MTMYLNIGTTVKKTKSPECKNDEKKHRPHKARGVEKN